MLGKIVGVNIYRNGALVDYIILDGADAIIYQPGDEVTITIEEAE